MIHMSAKMITMTAMMITMIKMMITMIIMMVIMIINHLPHLKKEVSKEIGDCRHRQELGAKANKGTNWAPDCYDDYDDDYQSMVTQPL